MPRLRSSLWGGLVSSEQLMVDELVTLGEDRSIEGFERTKARSKEDFSAKNLPYPEAPMRTSCFSILLA